MFLTRYDALLCLAREMFHFFLLYVSIVLLRIARAMFKFFLYVSTFLLRIAREMFKFFLYVSIVLLRIAREMFHFLSLCFNSFTAYFKRNVLVSYSFFMLQHFCYHNSRGHIEKSVVHNSHKTRIKLYPHS